MSRSDAADPVSPTPDESQPEMASLGYSGAMAELASILTILEDDDLDIDQLADHVTRAAELIAACRDRLDAARFRVTEIVADLDAG